MYIAYEEQQSISAGCNEKEINLMFIFITNKQFIRFCRSSTSSLLTIKRHLCRTLEDFQLKTLRLVQNGNPNPARGIMKINF